MSKRFLISEDDRQSILSLYKSKGIIFEEEVYDNKTIVSSEPISDQQVAWNLERDINTIILGDERKGIKGIEEDIFGQLSLRFSSGGGSKPTTFSFLMNGNSTGERLQIPNNGRLDVEYLLVDENISIQKYLKPIYENPDYKILFEKYPQLKRYIESFVVEGYFLPGRSKRTIIITFKLTKKRDSFCKGKTLYQMNDEIPIGKIMTVESDNGFSLDIGKRNCGVLEIDNASTFIPKFKIPNPLIPEDTTPIPPNRFIPRSIGGANGDPFIFNKTDLSGIGNELLEKFINQFIVIKNSNPNLYNTYIDFLKKRTNSIDVVAYASIDEDPEQVVNYVVGTNAVEGCGGKQKRHDYNQCLSQKRADKVAAILNEKLPDFPDFIGKGLGETDKFAPGKKWPKSSREETLPNRRFDVVLPYYEDYVPGN